MRPSALRKLRSRLSVSLSLPLATVCVCASLSLSLWPQPGTGLYDNLQAYIQDQTPLRMDTVILLSKIVPEARDFFYAQAEASPPVDPLAVMMAQRRRRITRNNYDEDTDDED